MSNYESLLADALQLPIADRIQLIDAIWDTLPVESLPALTEDWEAEVRRRSAEFDSGATGTIAWDVIQAEALRRAGVVESDASS